MRIVRLTVAFRSGLPGYITENGTASMVPAGRLVLSWQLARPICQNV